MMTPHRMHSTPSGCSKPHFGQIMPAILPRHPGVATSRHSISRAGRRRLDSSSSEVAEIVERPGRGRQGNHSSCFLGGRPGEEGRGDEGQRLGFGTLSYPAPPPIQYPPASSNPCSRVGTRKLRLHVRNTVPSALIPRVAQVTTPSVGRERDRRFFRNSLSA